MMACQRPLSYPTPSLSSSTHTHAGTATLTGTRWRKKLARLSKKLQSGTKQARPLSGTAAAAATEKLIRRPKATVQTEDLTASQFAFMAGIKIQRGRYHQDEDIRASMDFGDYHETDEYNDSDYSDDGSDSDCNEMLPISMDHRHLTAARATKTHHGSIPCMTSLSSSSYITRYHPIWDARFWQQQQQDKPDDTQTKPSSSANTPAPPTSSLVSTSERYSDLSTNDTLSSAASTLDTCLTAPTSKPQILHKGRFQIVLGNDHTTKPSGEPLIRTGSSESSNHVVEWHRKRAMTH